MAEDCMLGSFISPLAGLLLPGRGVPMISPLAGLPLPDHDINTHTSVDDFVIKLERIAALFYEVLQESKSKLLGTPLSAITVICDIARFMLKEVDVCNYSLGKKEQYSQTILASKDVEMLYTRATQTKLIQDEIVQSSKNSSFVTIEKTNPPCNNAYYQYTIGVNSSSMNGEFNHDTCGKNDIPLQRSSSAKFIHKCLHCSKEFTDKRNLRSHLMIHEKEKTFECEVCKKMFLRSSQLKRHKRIHTGEQPYKCTDCPRKFADISNLTVHMKKAHPTFNKQNNTKNKESNKDLNFSNKSPENVTVSKKREENKDQFDEESNLLIENLDFTCNICGKKVLNRSAYNAHMKRHVSTDGYCCEFCAEVFDNLHDLKEHSRHHIGERPYTCTVCQKDFKCRGSLRSHMFQHAENLPYSCQICGKSFSQTSSLNAHKLTHTAEEEWENNVKDSQEADADINSSNDFTCHICGKSYKTHQRLSSHIESHNIQDFPCDFCDKKFMCRNDLVVHRRTHTKDKYTCTVCGSGFKSRSVYYYHMLTHPAERPYKCDKCGKSFPRSSDLDTHKKRHEITQKSTSSFICNVCNKVYQTKFSLKVHMKSHQGIFDHPCKFCDKKFKSPAELRHHQRVHTLEKPYTCDYCYKSFARHSTLVNHKRIHTGERPYLCIICGAAFKLLHTLNKHTKMHARQEGQGKRNKSSKPRKPRVRKIPQASGQGPENVVVNNTIADIVQLHAPEMLEPPVIIPKMDPQHIILQPQQPTPHQIIFNHDNGEIPPTTFLLTPALKQTIATLIPGDSSTLLQQLDLAGTTINFQSQPQQQQQYSDINSLETFSLPANIYHLANAGDLHLRNPEVMTSLINPTSMDTVRDFLTTNNDLDLSETVEPLEATVDLGNDVDEGLMDMIKVDDDDQDLEFNPSDFFY